MATYLILHYNLSAPPNYPKNLDKFNSDASKWYLFVENFTEEVWQELKQVIDDDYAMKLLFQSKCSKDSSSADKEEGNVQLPISIDSMKATKLKARQEGSHVCAEGSQWC